MIKLISVGGIPNSPLDEYICDTDDDLFSLEPAPFGTIVFCAEDGRTYIAGGNGEFVEKPTGGGSSGNSGNGGGTADSGRVELSDEIVQVKFGDDTYNAKIANKSYNDLYNATVIPFIYYDPTEGGGL